ncbi:MAG: prepilin-type N-terminal cleavage/methylation domain-containing protein [Patescibacteria group bacterium]|nr:prepilin-type N-terminal cleavage/methylation domain-containing protein [Patescibacteria group bacterium]
MNHRTNQKQSGFTIVELMIAISVLSVILLLVSVGIIQLSKQYYRGIVQATTQQAARNLMDDVTQSIEFGSFNGLATGTLPTNPSYGPGYSNQSYCIQQQRYSYVIGYEESADDPTGTTTDKIQHSKHALWKDDTATDCTPLDVGLTNPSPSLVGKDMLGDHMRLTKFAISPATVNGLPSSQLFNVTITIMYGDDDLMNKPVPSDPSTWTCISDASVFSAAFCSKAQLTTVVGKRLS